MRYCALFFNFAYRIESCIVSRISWIFFIIFFSFLDFFGFLSNQSISLDNSSVDRSIISESTSIVFLDIFIEVEYQRNLYIPDKHRLSDFCLISQSVAWPPHFFFRICCTPRIFLRKSCPDSLIIPLPPLSTYKYWWANIP